MEAAKGLKMVKELEMSAYWTRCVVQGLGGLGDMYVPAALLGRALGFDDEMPEQDLGMADRCVVAIFGRGGSGNV